MLNLNQENYIYKKISYWLFISYILGLSIVLVGGATRLTDSGLSIVEWDLFYGIFPPVYEEDWQTLFSKYKGSLEYEKRYKSKKMTVNDFKSIFILEYLHRLLARVLGIFLFVFPFLYFFIRYYWINRILVFSDLLKILGLFFLVFFQGFLGWFMVYTGLNSDTAYILGNWVRVNPYSLFFHFLFAFLLLTTNLLLAIHFREKAFLDDYTEVIFSKKTFKNLKRSLEIFFSILLITFLFGSLVAGMKAGLYYKSFPLMYGYFLPHDLLSMDPLYLNFLKNPITVQFFHRIFAFLSLFYTLFIFYNYYTFFKKFPSLLKRLFYGLIGLTIIQFTLGIFTLMTFTFPIELSSIYILFPLAHQMIGFLLLTVVCLLYYYLFYSRSYVFLLFLD